MGLHVSLAMVIWSVCACLGLMAPNANLILMIAREIPARMGGFVGMAWIISPVTVAGLDIQEGSVRLISTNAFPIPV